MILTVPSYVEKARANIAQLTGQPVATVISCGQEGERFRVTLETLERKAVPDTLDLLATYAVILDEEGGLVNFCRLRTRRRGDPIEEDGAYVGA